MRKDRRDSTIRWLASRVLLDLHYSDNWADPGRQEIPAAWADITDDAELAEAVYAAS